MKLILDENFNATVVLPTAVAIPEGNVSSDTDSVTNNADSGIMTLPAEAEDSQTEGATDGEILGGDGTEGAEGSETLGGDGTEGAEGGEILDGDGTEGTEGGEVLDGDGTEGTEGGEVLDGDGTEGTENGEVLDGDGTEGTEGGEVLDGDGTEGDVGIDPGVDGDMIGGDMDMIGGDMGMMGDGMDMMEGATTPKDPILSSWPFVIGISVLEMAIGVGLGVLWAKLKIKKGIDLYED